MSSCYTLKFCSIKKDKYSFDYVIFYLFEKMVKVVLSYCTNTFLVGASENIHHIAAIRCFFIAFLPEEMYSVLIECRVD